MTKLTLKQLVHQGWKDVEIKYTQFRVYEKHNERILYDTEKQKIIKKYQIKREQRR